MYTAPATERKSQNQRAQAGTKPRTPLQERTQSQTNEDSARLAHESRHGPSNIDIFSATPFPTKPQHILLPSTIRKQRSFRDVENLYAWNQPSGFSRPSTSGQNETGPEELGGRKAPVLQLKRSVSTLRDMYEAQAERSRPSTAASFARPGTAGSRLRSASSSEGLSTRIAWEQLHQVSADDMALLPSLSRSSMEKLASDSSFASRVEQANFVTSTPNYKTFGSSSPRFPVFHDRVASISDEYNQSSSSGAVMTSSSSPNFVRLGRSSSIVDTLNTEQSSSSPNFVKLGTSSPGLRTSSSPSSDVLETSRKRKRTNDENGRSFAARSRPFSSSPPYAVIGATSSEQSLKSPDSVMPSSPPHPESMHSQSIGNSSPVYRLPGRPRDVSDSSSGSSTHASLQAALSSSPIPPIQYPVIRAPAAAASTLNIPKRITRNSSTETASHWPTKLSPVPSEWDEGSIRSASRKSQRVEELVDDLIRSDSISPEPTGNESQVCIIPVPDDDHQHEASDELRALPRGLAYRSPPLVPVRTNSLFRTASSSSNSQSQSRLDSLRTSVDTRLNSMKSFAHSRQNSFISGSGRPSSSGSQSTSVIVPTWARRYYSGFYRDSFQYLYPSQTNSASQLSVPAAHNTNRPISMVSLPSHQRASMAASRDSRRSWQSIRNSLRSSMLEYVPSVLLPRNHAQSEARKSHVATGVGPLVSNPVSPETAHTRAGHHRQSSTIRQVPEQLPAADPRAHWAGITEEQRTTMRDIHSYPYQGSHQVHRLSAEGDSIYYDAASGQIIGRYRFTDVPHLHHDRRLNTGSSMSRGFGFPFNRKARYQAPSINDGSDQPSWFQFDLRDAQVTCFILGFVCPLVWFVAALLPLPKRPESFDDLEKAVYDQYNEQTGERHDLDIVARLRLERHIKGIEELKWQNARWWKRMNKWMCLVGVVVIVLIIVLAVIGTRNHW